MYNMTSAPKQPNWKLVDDNMNKQSTEIDKSDAKYDKKNNYEKMVLNMNDKNKTTRKSITKITKLVYESNYATASTRKPDQTTYTTRKYNSTPQLMSPKKQLSTVNQPSSSYILKNKNSITDINENKPNYPTENNSTVSATAETNDTELKLNFEVKKMEREKYTDEFKTYLQENLTIINNNNSNKLKEQFNENIEAPAAVGPDLKFDFVKNDNTELPSPSKSNQLQINPITNHNTDIFKSKPSCSINSHRKNRTPASDANTNTCMQQKTYDPEKAKLFIKEQQKKRKLENNTAHIQTNIKKEEIQKRLLELRKNSRKILHNNIKKSKQINTQDDIQNNVMLSGRKDTDKTHQNSTINHQVKLNVHPILNIDVKDGSSNRLQGSSNKECSQPSPPSSLEIPNTSNQDNNICVDNISKPSKISNAEKIGILRRTAMMIHEIPELNTDIINNLRQKSVGMSRKRKSCASEKSITLTDSTVLPDIEKELVLEIPDSVLKLKSAINTINTNENVNNIVANNNNGETNKIQLENHSDTTVKREMPYWLRPSPVQIYPYNFIMAVRKKLESITEPAILFKNDSHIKKPSITENSSSKMGLDEKSAIRKNTKSRSVPPSSSLYKSDFIEETKFSDNNAAIESKQSSDVITNFSSITLQIPESNTISDVSSIVSDSMHHTATINLCSTKIRAPTTSGNHSDGSQNSLSSISSVIYSQSSPDKKSHNNNNNNNNNSNNNNIQYSPLLLNNIDSLKVVSRNERTTTIKHDHDDDDHMKKPHSFINFNRGKDFTHNRIVNNENNSDEDFNKNKTFNKSDDIDIRKMLEAFNQSLTQVITANQKLHLALTNPPAPQPPPPPPPSIILNNKNETVHTSPYDNSTINNYSNDFTGDDNSKTTNTFEICRKDKRKSQNSQPVTLSDGISSNKLKDNETYPIIDSNENLYESKALSDVVKNNLIKSNATNTNENDSIKTINTDTKSTVSNKVQEMTEILSDISINVLSVNNDNNFSNSNKENCSIGTEISDGTGRYNETSQYILNKEGNTIRSKNNEKHDDNSKSNAMKEINGNQLNKMSLLKNNAAAGTTTDKYKIKSISESDINSTIGNDIFTIFNQSEFDFSSINGSQILYEDNLSYSSIGMYEQLIQNETRKSDHLMSLIKIREKCLIDRTKGQLAWLELQKQKYKEIGLNDKVPALKKKQRALLIRLENKRYEIQKLIKSANKSPTTAKSNNKLKFEQITTNISINDASTKLNRLIKCNHNKQNPIKGYEIATNNNLEKILSQRETELQKRRNHVEHLIKWHQRLDNDEQEVIEMEKQLMIYTTDQKTISATSEKHNNLIERKLAKNKIKHIDKSLEILHNISTSTINISNKRIQEHNEKEKEEEEEVHVLGNRMNRLWRRLTGRSEEKFIPTTIYKLQKLDMERIYEEAKTIVLSQFNNENSVKKLFDQSTIGEQYITDRSSLDDHNVNANGDSINLSNKDINSIEKNNLSIKSEQYEKQSTDNSLINSENILFDNLNFKFSTDVSITSSTNVSAANIENDFNTIKQLQINNSDVNILPTSETCINKNKGNHLYDELQSSLDDIEEDIPVDTDIIESNESNIRNNSPPNDLEIHSKNSSNTNTLIESIIENTITTNNDYETKNISNLIQQFDTKYTKEQLIDDISIPNFEITITNDTINDNIMFEDKLNEEFDDKYLSDEFEKSTDNNLSEISKNKSEFNQSSVSYNDTDISCSERSTISEQINTSSNEIKSPSTTTGLEKCLINIDDTLKVLNDTLEKAPIMELKSQIINNIENEHNKENIVSNKTEYDEDENKENECNIKENIQKMDIMDIGRNTSELKMCNKNINENFPFTEIYPGKSDEIKLLQVMETATTSSSPSIPSAASASASTSTSLNIKPTTIVRDYVNSSNEYIMSTNKMPDIISEAEVLRRQQIQIEEEIKTLEQSVPYVFLREIPNKPPPPYIPPAHGSPMTTIFPSDERIEEIVFRRVTEFYSDLFQDINNEVKDHDFKINNGNEKPISIVNENITNIYERIILDVCKECMDELKLQSPSPQNRSHEQHVSFKYPLAFYNPPNRLQCMQTYVHTRIKKLLEIGYSQQITLPQSIALGCSRRKRDIVDDILVQEMFEDEYKWTNYDIEEIEVQNNLTEEILIMLVDETMNDVEDICNKQT